MEFGNQKKNKPRIDTDETRILAVLAFFFLLVTAPKTREKLFPAWRVAFFKADALPAAI